MRKESESKSTAEQQIETPGPLQTRGNSKQGTLKDEISEKGVENVRVNSGVQQIQHKRVTMETENVTRFEDETDKTTMGREKIATVKEQMGETQDTMLPEKNVEETPIMVEVNENSENTNGHDQNTETDNENQTAKQGMDSNGNKSSDQAYLFEQYLKRRSLLPDPCFKKVLL